MRSADEALDDAEEAAEAGDKRSALVYLEEAAENSGGRLPGRLQERAKRINNSLLPATS